MPTTAESEAFKFVGIMGAGPEVLEDAASVVCWGSEKSEAAFITTVIASLGVIIGVWSIGAGAGATCLLPKVFAGIFAIGAGLILGAAGLGAGLSIARPVKGGVLRVDATAKVPKVLVTAE